MSENEEKVMARIVRKWMESSDYTEQLIQNHKKATRVVAHIQVVRLMVTVCIRPSLCLLIVLFGHNSTLFFYFIIFLVSDTRGLGETSSLIGLQLDQRKNPNSLQKTYDDIRIEKENKSTFRIYLNG